MKIKKTFGIIVLLGILFVTICLGIMLLEEKRERERCAQPTGALDDKSVWLTVGEKETLVAIACNGERSIQIQWRVNGECEFIRIDLDKDGQNVAEFVRQQKEEIVALEAEKAALEAERGKKRAKTQEDLRTINIVEELTEYTGRLLVLRIEHDKLPSEEVEKRADIVNKIRSLEVLIAEKEKKLPEERRAALE